MYARLIRFTDLEPGRFEPTLEWLGAEVFPALARVSGYRTIFVGTNPDKGRAAAVTFWGSMQELKASEKVERPLREEARSRAGGDVRSSRTEIYQLGVSIPAERHPQFARLTLWERLAAERSRAAHARYAETAVPELTRLPGFAGTFSAIDPVIGNVLGVFLWDSREAMTASFEWERSTVAEIEEITGPRRSVIADSYRVDVAPELEPATTAA